MLNGQKISYLLLLCEGIFKLNNYDIVKKWKNIVFNIQNVLKTTVQLFKKKTLKKFVSKYSACPRQKNKLLKKQVYGWLSCSTDTFNQQKVIIIYGSFNLFFKANNQDSSSLIEDKLMTIVIFTHKDYS